MRKPYSLPDSQCERLLRPELIAVRMLLASLSSASYAKEDLQKRLECVPDGNRRLRLALGGLKAVCDDLVGTITSQQAKQLLGTMKDYEMRLVPKLTPLSENILLTKEQGKDLIDCAREMCNVCTRDGHTCRECRLYKLLEATTPLDHYGDDIMCPYSLATWEN